MTTRVKLRSAAAAVALIAATSVAHANDFFPESGFPSPNLTLNNAGGSTSAGVGATNLTIKGNQVSGDSSYVSAGGFSVLDTTDRFIAWCLDTMKELRLGTQYEVNNSNPFSNNPRLSTQQKSDIQALFNYGYDTFLGFIDPDSDGVGSANNAQSAGFQVALWEIVNENTGSYDAGDADSGFWTTNGTIAGYANDYLDLIDPSSVDYTGTIGNDGKGYRVSYLESIGDPSSQNLVTVSPVPLPAAGFLLLAGLGGLAASRKLRRRADA